MGQNTKIEWTDATWNPIIGCSRVSEGCRNCYAEGIAGRFGNGSPTVYSGLTQIVNGRSVWTGEIKETKQLLQPLGWKKPKRVFVNSMSDLFHKNVTDEMRDRIFAVMALAPQHIFQVLTKRPERMLAYMTEAQPQVWDAMTRTPHRTVNRVGGAALAWPLPNVWLGVSVENQAAADERIPLLLQTLAAVRFISAEPLLGPILLDFPRAGRLPSVDWVIVGGESGPGARPMHPDWARGMRDQCVAAGVPFFFKQHGEWMPVFTGIDPSKNDSKCRIHDGFTFPPNDGEQIGQHMWKVGKKGAGHELDGKMWQQFPAVPR